MQNDTSKNKSSDNKSDDPVEQGKKAIEMDKKVTGDDKSEEEKDKAGKADAEKWRNEG